jgi:hypothetical protein
MGILSRFIGPVGPSSEKLRRLERQKARETQQAYVRSRDLRCGQCFYLDARYELPLCDWPHHHNVDTSPWGTSRSECHTPDKRIAGHIRPGSLACWAFVSKKKYRDAKGHCGHCWYYDSRCCYGEEYTPDGRKTTDILVDSAICNKFKYRRDLKPDDFAEGKLHFDR